MQGKNNTLNKKSLEKQQDGDGRREGRHPAPQGGKPKHKQGERLGPGRNLQPHHPLVEHFLLPPNGGQRAHWMEGDVQDNERPPSRGNAGCSQGNHSTGEETPAAVRSEHQIIQSNQGTKECRRRVCKVGGSRTKKGQTQRPPLSYIPNDLIECQFLIKPLGVFP